MRKLPLLVLLVLPLLGGCASSSSSSPTAQTEQVNAAALVGMDIHDVFLKFGVDKGDYKWGFYDVAARQMLDGPNYGGSDFSSAFVLLYPKSGTFHRSSDPTFYLRIKNDKVIAAGTSVDDIIPHSAN